MQGERDIVGHVHPLPVHGADDLHEAVEKTIERGALQRVRKGNVVIFCLEAGETVSQQGKESFGRGKHDEGPVVGFLQGRIQGEYLSMRVRAGGKPGPRPRNRGGRGRVGEGGGREALHPFAHSRSVLEDLLDRRPASACIEDFPLGPRQGEESGEDNRAPRGNFPRFQGCGDHDVP